MTLTRNYYILDAHKTQLSSITVDDASQKETKHSDLVSDFYADLPLTTFRLTLWSHISINTFEQPLGFSQSKHFRHKPAATSIPPSAIPQQPASDKLNYSTLSYIQYSTILDHLLIHPQSAHSSFAIFHCSTKIAHTQFN